MTVNRLHLHCTGLKIDIILKESTEVVARMERTTMM